MKPITYNQACKIAEEVYFESVDNYDTMNFLCHLFKDEIEMRDDFDDYWGKLNDKKCYTMDQYCSGDFGYASEEMETLRLLVMWDFLEMYK